MKKIFFLLLGFIAAVSAKAQVVEVYENGTLIHIYNNTPATKYTVTIRNKPYCLNKKNSRCSIREFFCSYKEAFVLSVRLWCRRGVTATHG